MPPTCIADCITLSRVPRPAQASWPPSSSLSRPCWRLATTQSPTRTPPGHTSSPTNPEGPTKDRTPPQAPSHGPRSPLHAMSCHAASASASAEAAKPVPMPCRTRGLRLLEMHRPKNPSAPVMGLMGWLHQSHPLTGADGLARRATQPPHPHHQPRVGHPTPPFPHHQPCCQLVPSFRHPQSRNAAGRSGLCGT